jgi:leader peptidase (prepilin peptidase)/N-methyltransferase
LVDHNAFWLWTACILGWTLLALAWIDVEHMRLPDALTLPLLAAGIGVQVLLSPERLPESMIGVVVGYASFHGISIAYRAIRGREGLGRGDAKLMAAGGAWVGWSALPDLVLIAALLAILVVMLTRMKRPVLDRTTVIPFGPFLAASMWLIYVYGPPLEFWFY